MEEWKSRNSKKGEYTFCNFDSDQVQNDVSKILQCPIKETRDTFESCDNVDIYNSVEHQRLYLGIEAQKKPLQEEIYELSEDREQEIYQNFSKINDEILRNNSQESLKKFIKFKNFFKSYSLEYWINKEEFCWWDVNKIIWRTIQQRIITIRIKEKDVTISNKLETLKSDTYEPSFLKDISQQIINLHNEAEKLKLSECLEKEELYNVRLALQQKYEEDLEKHQLYLLERYKEKWRDILLIGDNSLAKDLTTLFEETMRITEALEIFQSDREKP